MKNFWHTHHSKLICIAIALIHTLITFRTDGAIFTAEPSVNPIDYCICKILVFTVLSFFYYGLFLLGRDLVNQIRYRSGKTEESKRSVLTQVVLTALPYLPVIAAVAWIKLPQGFLSNDEILIAENALNLKHDTWFYYLTVYYYIVSYMLIPLAQAPILVKLFLEFLVVGSLVYRMKKVFGKPYGYFGYALFLLYPVIAYTTSAHRLPIYFLLYLLLMSTLIFDGIEEAPLPAGKAFGLLFLGAILTQWRTEGIYLAVLVPVLMLFTYVPLRKMKPFLLLIVSTVALQYVISVPQNGVVAKEMGAAADDRMKPFYAYTITNMFRNGLDREKNADDLAVVDRYLSLEKIDAINAYYGDINYEDVLILYQTDYVGVRENATVTDFFNYANALKRIFRKNPDVLLKTRVGAFCYAALPYRIETGNGAVGFGVSLIKTVMYQLFLPLALLFAICLYALFRKRFFTFFLTAGILTHWFIVFMLAPASYFKYYFPVYIMAYFYALLLLLQWICRRRPEAGAIRMIR